jgi:imidazolonepropionase-like amidohydrolase
MWLRNVRLVDTIDGSVTASSIEIVDGRVRSLGDPPPQAGSLDLRGGYVLPGLISCHTHLQATYPYEARNPNERYESTLQRAITQANATLYAGITTVRCVHELHAVDLAVRDAIKQGTAAGPRIYAAGRGLTVAGGHGDGLGCRTATGEHEFEQAALAELNAGADHVKVFASGGLARAGESLDAPEMSFAEMRGAVRAAAGKGTYVVAHAAGSRAIARALDAGIRSFEHAYRLDEETAGRMAASSAFLGATLVVTHSASWMRSAGFSGSAITRSAVAADEHLESAARAIRAGVTMVNSTDFPPGSSDGGVPLVVREMELAVVAGLDPLGAIQAATLNAANLIGDPMLGRLQIGSPADMVIVDGNPAHDIRAMRDIKTVIQAGRVVRHRR